MPINKTLDTLTAAASLASTDIMYVMLNPASTKDNRKCTVTVLATAVASSLSTTAATFQTLTLSHTAPTITMTDTTASAKSLTLTVDANIADFKESAGAAGSLLTLDLTNNRVGVANSAPAAKIHIVAATEQVRAGYDGSNYANITVASNGATTVATVGSAPALNLTPAAGSSVVVTTSGAGDFVVNSTQFYVDSSASAVGIGTATPSSNMHVKESTTDTMPAVLIEQASTGDAGVLLGISGRSYSLSIDNSDGDALKISTAASATGAAAGTGDLVTVSSAGQVGIGTSATGFGLLGNLNVIYGGAAGNGSNSDGVKTVGVWFHQGLGAPDTNDTTLLVSHYANSVNSRLLDLQRSDTSDNGTGTSVFLVTGNGNVCIATTAAGTSAVGVLAIGNGTAPTSNITGIQIYAESGAAKVRGSGGTITTFGPAEPHCPKCGRDFMHEWQSDRYGYLATCMWCLTEELGDRPYVIRRNANVF